MMKKTTTTFLRRVPSVLLAVCCGALLPCAVPAQQTGFAHGYAAPGINGRVFGLGTWNGDLYAGGPFRFQAGGGELHRIARHDGRDWQDVGGGADGDVRAFAVYGNELIVGGAFDQVGSVRAQSIARWNGTRWATLGAGFTAYLDEVFVLAVFQGELYAGGRFREAGGQPIAGIARWDGVSWRPVGGGLGSNGGSPIVISFEVVGSTLYVGGEFTTAGGLPAQCIAAWDGTSWSALGTGLNSGVHALAWFGGQLYAGGNFRKAGSVDTLKIARWNGMSWGPVGLGIPDSSISVQVDSLHTFGGDLWVGGSFGEVDTASRGMGLHASGLARWDGNAWHSVGGLYRNAFGGQTYGIAMTVHDGRLVVGGDFDHAGPLLDHENNVVSSDVVAWDGSRFHAVGEGVGAFGTKSVRWNGSTWTLTNLYAGQAVSPQISRFDGARWHVVEPLHPRSDVDDMVVFQGALHFTGALEFLGGPTLTGVVRYDGRNWTPLGGPKGDVIAVHAGELYVGGLGGVQRLTGSGWVSLPTLYGQVEAMQPFQGRLYIGGSRLSAGSGPTVNLLVWDGQTLAPVGQGLDGTVTVMHEHAGELWIGGWFSTASAVSSPRLVRFDGTGFRPFPGPTIPGQMVRTLATLAGDLFIGGDLGVIGTTRATLAHWNGATLTTLGEGVNSTPSHLLPDEATGKLWITGGFWRANTTTSHGIAVWQTKPRWDSMGAALARSNGVRPLLEGFGAFRQGERVALRASGLAPGELALLFLGSTRVDLPLFGGTLVPTPQVSVPFTTDPVGAVSVDVTVPSGLPPGFSLFGQVWGADTPRNEISATNAVLGR